jgi:Arc/MetJ family transcription regulator
VPFTYDPTTDRGLVRLLITDVDSTQPLFQDVEVDAFLALQAGSVKRAAAQALDVIASNEALVQKATRLMDLTTDGPAVAKALREHAVLLRDQVLEDEARDGAAFDWAEMALGSFGVRERVENQWIREQG